MVLLFHLHLFQIQATAQGVYHVCIDWWGVGLVGCLCLEPMFLLYLSLDMFE